MDGKMSQEVGQSEQEESGEGICALVDRGEHREFRHKGIVRAPACYPGAVSRALRFCI